MKKFGIACLFLGILFLFLSQLPWIGQAGSRLFLWGFLGFMIGLLTWVGPWIFYYTENQSKRRSNHLYDHPERLPLISTFPNGDLLIGVQERRYRMWRTETSGVVCQQIDPTTGHPIGQRLTSASQAVAIGIPNEIYKRLEQALKTENRFL